MGEEESRNRQHQSTSTGERLKAVGKNLLKGFWDFFVYAAGTALIVMFITKVFVLVSFVPTGSMNPTIPTGSIVICLRTDYWNNDPQRGDVVMFRRDVEDDDRVYAKRIVGEPGDVIEIRDGQTYINGEVYEETWLNEDPDDLDFGPFEVPEGKYFCMGDNRNKSTDCRYWEEHYIERDDIIARGRIVLSPEKIGFLPNVAEKA